MVKCIGLGGSQQTTSSCLNREERRKGTLNGKDVVVLFEFGGKEKNY